MGTTPEEHRRIITEIHVFRHTDNLTKTFAEYNTVMQRDEKALDMNERYMTVDILSQMAKVKKNLDKMYKLLFKLNNYRKVKDHHATPLSKTTKLH